MEATGLKDYLATRLGILKEWALRASTVDHPPIYIGRISTVLTTRSQIRALRRSLRSLRSALDRSCSGQDGTDWSTFNM